MIHQRKIVFYDGDCGFCNTSIQFVLDHESSNELYFSALQSNFTKSFLNEHQYPFPETLDSIIFFDGDLFFERSTAVLQISNYLRAPYSWLKVLLIFPKFIRDPFYNFIAKRRQKIKRGVCVVPTKEQLHRFLD